MHEYQILQSLDLWFGGYCCGCANVCAFDYYLAFLPLPLADEEVPPK